MALANRAIAVPIVAVITSFHILIGSITRPVRLALLPYLGDHIIVCGSRTLTEAALTTLAKRRHKRPVLTLVVDESEAQM
jgi:hypothetical protein